MAVGSDAKFSGRSSIGYNKETIFGTYLSASAGVLPLSCSFVTEYESLVLPTLNINRGAGVKRVQTIKKVSGGIELYLHNEESPYFLMAALGLDTITSTAASTTTYIHTLTAGNMTTLGSMCFDVRKGETHTWRYNGGRINQLKISGKVGEPIKMSADFVFVDSTQGTTDLSNALTFSTLNPWMWHQCSYIYGATTTSITLTGIEPIQEFELTINNNIAKENEARQLGTIGATILPSKQRKVEFKIKQRFDTTTAYQRYVQATMGMIRLQFDGPAIGASGGTHQMIIDMPKVYQNKTDPELGGPDEILQCEITFDVLVDVPNTTTGKDIVITVQNGKSSY
jgi:hypothetical protein